MFKMSEIDGLQPHELAEVLKKWQQQLIDRSAIAAREFNGAPSVLATGTLQVYESVQQLFTTTIPAIASKRPGWNDKLTRLRSELHKVKPLNG